MGPLPPPTANGTTRSKCCKSTRDMQSYARGASIDVEKAEKWLTHLLVSRCEVDMEDTFNRLDRARVEPRRLFRDGDHGTWSARVAVRNTYLLIRGIFGSVTLNENLIDIVLVTLSFLWTITILTLIRRSIVLLLCDNDFVLKNICTTRLGMVGNYHVCISRSGNLLVYIKSCNVGVNFYYCAKSTNLDQ